MPASEATLVERIQTHAGAAIVTAARTFTYADLDAASSRVANALGQVKSPASGATGSVEPRVVFLVPPGADYVAVLLGIWKMGGIAVPLAVSHPRPELEHVLRDAQPAVAIAAPEFFDRLAPIAQSAGVVCVTTDDVLAAPTATSTSHARPEPTGRALMLYTSGTTGKPKGVVTTHANVTAQVTALIDAWNWSSSDHTLLALPLHHVHGTINVVCSALWAGARCEILPRFDAEPVWARLASGEITVFTAVPTMYHKLIESWDAAPRGLRRARSEGCRHVRLMMSGSAALPLSVLDRWRLISGHVLLERYGMTEIGMALANPMLGERRPGFVGLPLPRVDVRLVDEAGHQVRSGTSGEVEVRGPAVFLEYWRQPEATRSAFRDGWFRTGDVAVYEDGAYRLLGRASIDIIKTGGYKVSALEIEDVLRRHPAVADCAVVAVPDVEWGERVCAALELHPEATLKLDELQHWAKSQLAPYKVPRAVRCLPALPRNAMGKVMKPAVKAMFGT